RPCDCDCRASFSLSSSASGLDWAERRSGFRRRPQHCNALSEERRVSLQCTVRGLVRLCCPPGKERIVAIVERIPKTQRVPQRRQVCGGLVPNDATLPDPLRPTRRPKLFFNRL